MSYDYRQNKIVGVLDGSLEMWAALNVIGHLSVALGVRSGAAILGRSGLLDRGGIVHHGIAKYPFLIKKAKTGQIRKIVTLARLISDVMLHDYPKEMLDTGHDDELVDAIAGRHEEELTYLGILLFGPTEAVDNLTSKLTLWR